MGLMKWIDEQGPMGYLLTGVVIVVVVVLICARRK